MRAFPETTAARLIRWGGIAALVTGGVASSLILAEVILRATSASVPSFPYLMTPVHRLESKANRSLPGKYANLSYDARGYRTGSGLPYNKTVLFVGDSFTEGIGVADDWTFARAAERSLREMGIQARSLNAGHRGFGPAHELKILLDILDRDRVDALVIQSFPQNDIGDNIACGVYWMKDGRLVENIPPRPPTIIRFATSITGTWIGRLHVTSVLVNSLMANASGSPFDTKPAIDLQRALLEEIVSTARNRGIPEVLLIVPTKAVQHYLRAGGYIDKSELWRFEQVSAIVKSLGVPWIDAGEVIPDLAADAAKSDGGHFSRDGNALVGAAIARELAPLLRH